MSDRIGMGLSKCSCEATEREACAADVEVGEPRSREVAYGSWNVAPRACQITGERISARIAGHEASS